MVSCHVFYAVSESGRKGKKSDRGGSPSGAELQEEDGCVCEGLYINSYMTDKQHRFLLRSRKGSCLSSSETGGH